MCRKHTGAIHIPFVVVQEPYVLWSSSAHKDVRLSELRSGDGEYREYESSPNRFRGFCAKCGSSLVWRSPGEEGDTYELMAGTLDEHVLLGNIVPSSDDETRLAERDGTGLGSDLAVPKAHYYWGNSIPEFADLFVAGANDAKKHHAGSMSPVVSEEDVQRLRARAIPGHPTTHTHTTRSEERRVGKECRN